MKSVALNYQTRNSLVKELTFPTGEPEMRETESAFLSGLIERVNTASVVEVGIAGGGTTAIILKCLEEKKRNYKFYAVDYSEKFYRDQSKISGYLAKPLKEKGLKYGDMQFMLGGPLSLFIDEICDDKPIDFILLDTMHKLPGELLDFLLVLPYLSNGAIVCLHDISLNLKNQLRLDEIATNVLFNAVVADKYINLDLESDERLSYPNIGAFKINDDTRKYITNVFGLFSLSWSYIPPADEIMKYRDYYIKHYDKECIEIFDRAYEMNKNLNCTIKQKVRKAAKILIKGKY